MRVLREYFSVCICRSAFGVPFPQHLEILSFDTTVRRRPDRRRPPQVGPTCERPAPTTFRLYRIRCTSCETCTTAAAFNAGSEFRLLACRRRGLLMSPAGPSALRELFPADVPPFAPSSSHNLSVHPVLPIRRSREAETGGRGGNYFRPCRLPKSAQSRLPKTHCTDCKACTTAAAFNAGNEFRLLACRRPGS